MSKPIQMHRAENYTVVPSAAAQAPPRSRRERLPVIRPLRPRFARWYLPFKHTLDFLLATVLALPALVLVALSALLVKLTSSGPVFYTQLRVGRAGRPFTIFKIRTMIHNCESLTGPRWSMPGDPRITPVGWLLRKSHLDEVPQLLNVLRGEMSLIGPRPERPEFVPELEQALPAYRQRLLLRPGVTGLAQVQLPADTGLDSVRRKLASDLFYIEQVNPWLDFRLLVATGCYAVGLPLQLFGQVLAIPAAEGVERIMRDYVVEAGPARARLSA